MKSHNYGENGYYFITICTKNKDNFFGDIVDDKMDLSFIGKVADKFWREIPEHFPFVILDEFIIMPNHIHGIIIINKEELQAVETHNRASLQYKNKFGSQSKNLGSIIRNYKSAVKKYAMIQQIVFAWQPRFYDHIIRNERSLVKIREYIRSNPTMWDKDAINTENLFL
ncbi:MAG: transposase [candidate division Zixibacteria bacterium]